MRRWDPNVVGVFALLGLGSCGQNRAALGDGGLITDAPTNDVSTADATNPSDAATLPDASPDAPLITGSALQISDVSILFPLPTSLAERNSGMLTAASADTAGELLPAGVYDAIGPLLALSQQIVRQDLRVVAVRIDPCFAVLVPSPTGEGCEAQLRLILQPISEFPSDTGVHIAFDAGVHTFYRLTRAQVYAIKDALVALRLANSGGEYLGPLAPHPLLVAQGLPGPYGVGLRSLILSVAGASTLTRVATMSSTSSSFWQFRIFDVTDAANAQVAVRDIATLPAGTTTHALTAFNVTAPDASFSPAPASPDSFNELASTTNAQNLTTAARATQFDGLVRTENPRLTTPETVACAPCHFTMTARTHIAEPRFGLQTSASSAAFMRDFTVLSRIDLRPMFPALGSEFNVHAFSYNGTDAAIIQRTVNESAAIVEYFVRSPAP